MPINSFGDIVRLYRRLGDLSQLDLATRISKSQSWVYQVEHGYLQPSLGDRERLFKALNIDPAKLEVHQ
ncbi:MAG: helix-turn-helix transcriptional regulator [Candidatus Thiodiazotropha sp.]